MRKLVLFLNHNKIWSRRLTALLMFSFILSGCISDDPWQINTVWDNKHQNRYLAIVDDHSSSENIYVPVLTLHLETAEREGNYESEASFTTRVNAREATNLSGLGPTDLESFKTKKAATKVGKSVIIIDHDVADPDFLKEELKRQYAAPDIYALSLVSFFRNWEFLYSQTYRNKNRA
ncbi:hypothetical protein [Cyclobacterium plantarum]|uniref:hypothetical protein n=1 Tax=Cyclobacterium plantarum TaxID=2716263 RepID=UPI003F6FD7D1